MHCACVQAWRGRPARPRHLPHRRRSHSRALQYRTHSLLLRLCLLLQWQMLQARRQV